MTSVAGGVKEELGLTVSIGISFNKIFAKLGSDMKKPDAITEVSRENFKDKVWPLPASDMIYVGRATTKKLADKGIATIGDIAAWDPKYLRDWLGVNGEMIWNFASGNDTSRVAHRDFVSPVKSIGHGITCVADLENEGEAWKVMLELSQDIGHKLRVHELMAGGVQITVKNNDLYYNQYQSQFRLATRSPMTIAEKARELFRTRYDWSRPVRAVTVRAINLVPQTTTQQIDLFTDMAHIEKRDKLETAIEDIRRRFGKRSIYSAALMGDLKMPGYSSHEVVMPGMMYS